MGKKLVSIFLTLCLFIGSIFFFSSTKVYANSKITKSQADAAIEWAYKKYNAGDISYSGWCLAFVYDAYEYGCGIKVKRDSNARICGNHCTLSNNLEEIPPRGALCFYDWWGNGSHGYDNYGHVGISLGDGRVIHALSKVSIGNYKLSGNLTYTGWGIFEGYDLEYATQSSSSALSGNVSAEKYKEKMNKFITDDRWKDGAAWVNEQTPYLSSSDYRTCIAYAYDFTNFMYGYARGADGERYTSVSDIRTGDIVFIKPGYCNNKNGHAFVVLARNGNNLYTAEGYHQQGVVRIGHSYYSIKDGSIFDSNGTKLDMDDGYHFVTVEGSVADELTGTVTISGELKYGQTLTATISDTNNTGGLSYQWQRGTADIENATGNTYKLVKEDIGSIITCVVTSDVETGSITGMTSGTIAKQDGPAAPTEYTVTKPTKAGAADGMITLQSSNTYQYANNSNYNNAREVTGMQITGLKAGTYYVRIAETEIAKAGESAIITIPDGAAVLSGKVTISGTLKYGKTLTVNVSDSNNTGTLTYQWLRETTAISGATGSAYKLVKADIGKKISCVVKSSIETGSISATTSKAVEKANNNSAPTTVKTVDTSKKGAADGKITNITATIDYATDYDMTDIKQSTGDTVTGLAAGAYYIRYAETETHYAGPILVVTIQEGPEEAIAIKKQPTDWYGVYGKKASFTVEATGNNLTYCWQYKKSSNWITYGVTSYDTANFKITMNEKNVKWPIRCLITDADGNTLTTNEVWMKLKTEEPGPDPVATFAITSQPTDWYGTIGKKASFDVVATGNGLTYQWQCKKTNTWTDYVITTSNTANFKVTMNEKTQKWAFRCVITDANGNSLITNEVRMYDANTPIQFAITGQPSDYIGRSGKKATFNVTATGENLTYEWQVKKTTSWSAYALTGYDTPTFQVSINEKTLKWSYRCLIRDASGNEAVTNEVHIYQTSSSTTTLAWSDWVSTLPDGVTADEYEIQEKTQYSYRDKSMFTSSDASLEDQGYTLEAMSSEYSWSAWSEWTEVSQEASESVEVEQQTRYSYRDKETTVVEDWGEWSEWQNEAVAASDTRQVETRVVPATYKTQYNYSRYKSDNGWSGPTEGTWSSQYCYIYQERGWSDEKLEAYDWQYGKDGQPFNLYSSSTGTWYNEKTRQVEVTAAYTQYRYRDLETTTTESWGEWTEYSPSEVIATDTREVRTKEYYRTRTRTIVNTYTYSSWVDWTEFSDTATSASESRQVRTRKQYRYRKKN